MGRLAVLAASLSATLLALLTTVSPAMADHVDGMTLTVLGLAAHPVYGDVYVEVKDSSGTRNLLDLDEHDLSVRLVRDVQIDLHLQPLVPSSFSNDGRLAITPDDRLLRLVPPPLIGGPPSFAGYPVAR
jgi:hypothetical protein